MGVDGLRRGAIMAASALPLLPRDPGLRQPATGPSLSVLATNVELSQRDADRQARAVLAVDADVLCIIEATEATVAALARAGIATTHPHCSDDHDPGYFGSFIASRHLITGRWTGDLGGRPGHWVDLDVAGRAARVAAVHTQAPIHDEDVAVWHSTIASAAALAAAPHPVVLAGDWNTTGGHLPFRRALARHDLVDAQARRGHRWWPTWPVDHSVLGLSLPPVLALDHVVVSQDVAVRSLERIAIPACDHRAVRAALRLP
ncbi:MAG: endonuclease/exonuclease/phosphatase family protein [Iamia sp.]